MGTLARMVFGTDLTKRLWILTMDLSAGRLLLRVWYEGLS